MSQSITGLAAAALLAASASPAQAGGYHRYHGHHHDDVDADDLVAGAVVIGGIAAIAAAIKEDKRRKQDWAVDRCAGEAESRTGGQSDMCSATPADTGPDLRHIPDCSGRSSGSADDVQERLPPFILYDRYCALQCPGK